MPPWEKYQQAPPPQQPQPPPADGAPWQGYAAPKPVYSGAILPLSRDAQGKVSFDPNAGILGSLMRGAALPGQAMRGEVETYPGLTSEETIKRAADFGTMGLPLTPGLRAGEGVAGALLPKKVTPPSAAALKEAATSGYDAVRGMGVDFKASAVSDMAQRLKSHLIETSINEELAPAVFRTLDKLGNPPVGAVAQASDLLAARASFEDARLDFTHPRQRLAAEKSIAAIDELLSGTVPGTVRPAAGQGAEDATANAIKAGQAYDAANANYAAAKRSEKLTGTAAERANRKPGILEGAELQAAAANSGRNVGNNLRQGVKGLLKSPKERAGYSPEEIAQLEGVNRGSLGRNAARYGANFFGGGGGLAQALWAGGTAGAGATLGGPLGALAAVPPVAAGYGLKALENSLTKKALESVAANVRKRSPLYEELLKQAPQQVKTPEGRAALVRALLMTPVPPIPQTDPYSPFKT